MPNSPERANKIRQLFEELCELPASERADFLDRAGKDDPKLRRELRSLLDHADSMETDAEDFAQVIVKPLLEALKKNPDGVDKVLSSLSTGSPPDDSLVGRRISHFDILEPIGRGGMGVVYKARDTALQRNVALKFLPRNLTADSDAKTRFMTEARAASSLDHPAIATIHEIGETTDRGLFIAMAYYEGETLGKTLDRGPLSAEEALDIVTPLIDGLAKAHDKGIIHRDVKPGNIMICQDGSVKLLDFGLAKLVNVDGITQTSVTAGTTAYLSPEQTRGNAVDHRTDLWSLGVVLYETLTGRKPFQGDNAYAIIYSILHEEPKPIRDLSPGIDPILADLVGRCLEKNPDQRYQSAGNLLADLEDRLDNSAAASRMSHARARGARTASKKQSSIHNSRIFRGVIVCILILGTIIGIAKWVLVRPHTSDTAGATEGGSALASPFASIELSEPGKSIAVLPFINLSEDPENEYFSDGISEELLNVIAKIPNLRVPARTSSFYFKDKETPVKEMGEALQVEYLLQGSVRKAGNRVRIAAQLVDVKADSHVWSDSFTRELKDIFVLQDEIAGLIANQLQLELDVAPRAEEVDPEAHRLVLEASYSINQRGMDNFDQAIGLLEKALEIDPNFAKAHAAMALAWVLRASYADFNFGSDVTVELSNLQESANRAMELDPDQVEAYAAMALGLNLERKVKEAGEWFEKALAINPNDSTATLWYANHLLARGELLAASQAYEKCIKINPLDWVTAWMSGQHALTLGRFEDALRHLNRADSLRSGGLIPAKAAGGLSLWMLGQKDEAIEIARSTRQSFPSDPRGNSDINAIWVLVQAGLEEEVAEYGEMLLSELPPRFFKRGFILAALGRFEEAIPYLARTPALSLRLLASSNLFDSYREDLLFNYLLETLDWKEEYAKARADIEISKATRQSEVQTKATRPGHANATGTDERPKAEAEQAVPEKSIAVLPLENMSPDPENAFFADGVQTDILGNLSKINELSVTGRTSTLQYRKTVKTFQQIGEELGVRYLMEGSVRRAGKRVLVDVRLIDAQKERLIWSEKYNRRLDDIFEIQAEVAKEIAGKLQAILSTEEIARIEYRPTQNQEAYDLFTRYNQLTALYPGQSEERIALLEKAVILDPEFLEARALMAMGYLIMWNQGHRSDPELYKKAHHALDETRRVGPEAAFTFYAEGIFKAVEHNDRNAGIELLLKALEVDPSLSAPRTVLGVWYNNAGQLAEAQHILEELWRRDPYYIWTNRNLFSTYTDRENWGKARSLIQHNLKQSSELNGVWEFRKAMVDFLQFGFKQDYVSALETATGLEPEEAHRMKIRSALVKQDYPAALKLIQSGNNRDRFSLFPYIRMQFYITPLDLLSALIHFELNNPDKRLKASAKAGNYLAEIIAKNPNTEPGIFSNLVLCYALESNREAMESTIQKVRELTRQNYWKYSYEARCDLHIAMAYLVLGEKDKALETLEAASKMDGPLFLNRELGLWFAFDRLRASPRFDALLAD